jgi:hypothetical protein
VTRLQGEPRRARGERVWLDGNLKREANGFATRISAPEGVYRLAAGTPEGLRASASVAFPGDEPSPTLTLR